MRNLYKNLKLLSVLLLLVGIARQSAAQTESVAATTSYAYTGSIQSYIVPIGITHIVIYAQGAAGGNNSVESTVPDRPGYGGCISDTLAVTPGQLFYCVVGGQGGLGVTNSTGGAGGYNGGAAGSFGGSSHYAGGGGGGASDIRVGGTAIANRVIVGGGGGGAAVKCASTGSTNTDRGGDGGGNGSGSTTSDFAGETGASCVTTAATGGSYTTYGTGGACSICGGGAAGTNGDYLAVGNGGPAGGTSGAWATTGGGGGGGWHGGGGGAFNGGGGGSNYGSATSTNTRGCNNGVGEINVTPVCQTPGITGHSSVCLGLADTVYNTTAGGTWSSSDAGAIISINTTTGVLTGVAVGYTTITYTVGPCYVTMAFTVNELPGNTTAGDTVCVASTIAMVDTPGPGTWVSSNTAVATIISTTGVLSGVAYGTTIITYVLTATGCINQTVVQVDSLPSAITGMDSVCAGLTTTFSDVTSSGLGMWTSGNTTVATVDPVLGVVTGVVSGTSLVTYTVPTGACQITQVVTVNPLPNIINGWDSVCYGLSTTYMDTAAGGLWTSGNSMVASIGSYTGLVTGNNVGTTTITYTLPTTCLMTHTIEVNPPPAAIMGTMNVCAGLTDTVTDATSGGVFTSSNMAMAIIDSFTGVVSGYVSGLLNITYTLPTGCIMTDTFRVNPLPFAITGTDSVCAGLTTGLGDLPGGGVWSSSDATIATVDPMLGVVTGVAGRAVGTITYTLPTGCIMTTTLLVNPRAAITGPTSVCRFYNMSLSNVVPDGEWTSSNTSIATIDPTGGTVYGVEAGTAVMTYLVAASGCASYDTITVDSFSNITGTPTVCEGLTSRLFDSVAGGTWSVLNTSVATIDAMTGIVTGITTEAAGDTTTVLFNMTDGCTAAIIETVFPLTSIFGGGGNVCVGLTQAIYDTSLGGVWTSSNGAVAMVTSTVSGDTAIGTVMGVTTGTAVITYTLPTGCATYRSVTVAPLADITGLAATCQGDSTLLADATPGGTWSVGSSIAFSDTTDGYITGVTAGTATVTYELGSGCAAYATLTVYTMPVAIPGPDSVCVGSMTTLTDPTGGGTWSTTSGLASVVATTGVVDGVGAGTAVISYIMPGSCIVQDTLTINPLPPTISGNYFVCLGFTSTLSDGATGGTWTSGGSAIVPIDGTGDITGSMVGSAIITYTLPTSCYAIAAVTVNPLPTAISAALTTVCMGQTIDYVDGTPGGTWSSSTVTVGSITTISGIATGVSQGTSTITYTITNTGCWITDSLRVDSLEEIVGPAAVCSLSTISLTDAVTGGTWSSGTGFVAYVDGFGNVTGANVGTAVISYILPTGCFATATITVNPIPDVINGSSPVCATLSLDLTDGTAGGTWSSSVTSVGTIGSISGIVTAIASGTTTISYILPITGCYTTTTAVVYDLASIIGPDSLCLGSSTTLVDTAIGGSWSSTDGSVATITTGGFVVGASLGTTTISYTLLTGCHATITLTVDPLPVGITGEGPVCVGSTITLHDGTLGTGATWSSSNSAIGKIGSLTGIVTGVTAGTIVITYTLHTTCFITTTVLVNPLPGAIIGDMDICQGSTIGLTDGTAGGTWWSSITTVGSIGSTTGILGGVGGGTSIITYELPTTCMVTEVATVNPTPAITGTFNVCSGFQTTLHESILGGTWSSADIGVASVTGGGVVLGVWAGTTAGTTTITYTFATGCISIAEFTVNPLPALITGTVTVCEGSTTDLTDITAGGTWSSSTIAAGTIGTATGIVTGVDGGTAIISYTLPTGCYITTTVTVNPVTPILGATAVCVNNTITLTDATAGGSWWSSTTTVGSVGSTTGIVGGLLAGTTVISYLLPTGCLATSIITVNPNPALITGVNVVCTGANTTLTDATTGGNWLSNATGIATVTGFGTTGVVHGVAMGTDLITYQLPTTCYVVYAVSVNQSPAVITGGTAVCVGSTLLLGDGTVGGTWLSSNTAVGTVGSLTGLVVGITSGNTTISYQLPVSGCYSSEVLTVNALPTGITGATEVCVASNTLLSDVTGGGTWSSQYTTVANVVSTGVGAGTVTGVGAGTTLITYTLASSCYATYEVTVLPQPNGMITPIGDTNLCPGGFVALTASTGSTLSYQWYDGGSAISGATSATYIDSVAGTYSVYVRESTTGCSITSTGMAVTIDAVSGASVIALGGTTACSSTGVAFDALPTTGMTYQWEIDGIPISGATASTYTADSSGTFTAVITNTVGCSATASGVAVTILPALPGVLSLSGPLTFCAGGSITMTGDAGASSYQWYTTGLGAIVGATSESYTATVPGTYYLEEVNTIGCLTVSANAVVVVNALPSALITPSGTTTFCPGGSVTLFGPVVAGDIYQWYDGGSAITGANGNSYFTSTTGTYQLEVTNAGCSTTSAVEDVAVLITPTIVPLSPTSFCWGGNAVLSAEIVGGAGPVDYAWYYDGTLIGGATSAMYLAGTSGTYTVKVTVIAEPTCASLSSSTSVTEYPLPNPLITYSESVVRTQNYFTHYQWYNTSGPITGQNADTMIVSGNGTYRVGVTDANGCQSLSDNYVLSDWAPNPYLGVSMNNVGNDIKIYPNPAQTMVHIDAPVQLRVVLTTIDGKTVTDVQNVTEVNISALADGMYMIMLYDESGQLLKAEKLLKASN